MEMEIKDKYKWNKFNEEFIPFIEKKVTEIYAICINEDDASLITLENNKLVLNRYVNKNGFITTSEIDEFKFDSVKECLNYLRLIKEDHANNYDYRGLVKKLISQLYMNNHIKPEDVLS